MDSILTSTALKVPSIKQANVLNYTEFIEFKKDLDGKISGIVVKDKLN